MWGGRPARIERSSRRSEASWATRWSRAVSNQSPATSSAQSSAVTSARVSTTTSADREIVAHEVSCTHGDDARSRGATRQDPWRRVLDDHAAARPGAHPEEVHGQQVRIGGRLAVGVILGADHGLEERGDADALDGIRTSARLAPDAIARGERRPSRTTVSTAAGSAWCPVVASSARFSSTARAIRPSIPM